jgi:hypothetical protein
MRVFTCIVFALFLGQSASASILPKNNLHLKDNLLFAANMSEAEFSQRIDDVVRLWQPVASAYGVRLSSQKSWTDSTVNAYAEQNGSSWVVKFFGGLARRPEITGDGFSLVVCHELGHHFGGYYFFGSGSFRRMTSEGSADYFATQVCVPALWGNDHEENERFRALADSVTRRECDAVWRDVRSQNLCYRSTIAGKSLSRLFANLSGTPSPNTGTPNNSVVGSTNSSHPEAQCRLDTYFQGALCTRNADPRLIPGFRNTQDLNGINSELEANRYSCSTADGFRRGIRPRCWFRPQVL